MFSIKFLIVLFLLAAAAGYLIKKVVDTSDTTVGIEEVVAELWPLVDDPRRFGRHLKQYLRRKRIYGQGTVSGLPRPGPRALILPLEEHVTIGDGATAQEIDVLILLSFYGPDAPTEVGVGDYVEFTGILIDIVAKREALVVTVQISELSYIGEEPHPNELSDQDTRSEDL